MCSSLFAVGLHSEHNEKHVVWITLTFEKKPFFVTELILAQRIDFSTKNINWHWIQVPLSLLNNYLEQCGTRSCSIFYMPDMQCRSKNSTSSNGMECFNISCDSNLYF